MLGAPGRRRLLFAQFAVLLTGLVVASVCRRPHEPEQVPTPVSFPLSLADYPWPHEASCYEPLVQRFPPPDGFGRVPVREGSWGQWLRHLPLRPEGAPVVSRTGEVLVGGDSKDLGGVVDLDVRRYQECSDTILRLRAEFLRWAGREDEIVFHLTEGSHISWPEWKRGMRPRREGNRLRFYRAAQPDSSAASFERYLDEVFAWCGTYSLALEGPQVAADRLQVGDFFTRGGGGAGGHAALIVDLAQDQAGDRKALLLQGFMPAQSAHVVASGGSAWLDMSSERPPYIPRYGHFKWPEPHRFKGEADASWPVMVLPAALH